MLGIGGGGDVVGALGIARGLEARGSEVEVGGVAWERFSVDPHPGPRRLSELDGVEPIDGTAAALCSSAGRTPAGVRLCEAGVAAHLGRPTVLVDVTGGPHAIAAGIAAAADRLACPAVVLADVGGDVLATGAEPGLASPLCDSLMLAAASHLPARFEVRGCIFGAGCDGELTIGEALGRIAALARQEIWLSTSSPTAAIARELIEVTETVVTEASLQAARAALGELGTTPIRGGRRSVELNPVAALEIFFDARAAVGPAAPLAETVRDAASIEAARDLLEAMGIRTELDWERDRAAARPS